MKNTYQNFCDFGRVLSLAASCSEDYNHVVMATDTYQKTLDYLYSFVDFSLTRSFRYTPDKFDLGRMFELMKKLGSPEMRYASIHIAGTKGKGSVASMCHSVLQAAGYKTGLYTSPHLHDYAERIQVNGQPIPHEGLTELVNEIKPIIESIDQLTTFEITTAIAFLYFARQNVDVAVIEVGLGGRLDATNIVTPVISIITSLSYDHTSVLGNTLAEIAGEKAGIIKPGVPVILAPQKEEARLVVAQVAENRNAPLVQIGRDYLYAPDSYSLERQSFFVWPASDQPELDRYIESGGASEWEPTKLKIRLLGYHQIENAATAYAALQVFKERAFNVKESDIMEGFARVSWPGRFEVLQRNPTVVVDSAHNRDSALRLRLALDDYFPGEKVVLIFGASEDKDLYGMFAELMPRVDLLIATQSYHPRAMEIDRIVETAHQFGKAVTIIPDVAEALEKAIRA
ncbi:MAG TPA: folylpolyglutamate synthase/dihydrofolate synthase family protein, partial [Anaerolineales bacterium]|nr:folylpolyglutamate synthase/dihydrofolate synthase family protein [Anaerolineales bacterium]